MRVPSSDVIRATALRVLSTLIGVVAGVIIARLGDASVKGTQSAYAAANALLFLSLNFDLPQQILKVVRDTADVTIALPGIKRVWAIYVWIGAPLTILLFAFHLTGAVWLVVGSALFAFSNQLAILSAGLSGPMPSAIGVLVQQMTMLVTTLGLGLGESLTDTTVKIALLVRSRAPIPYVGYAVSRSSRGGDQHCNPKSPLPWRAMLAGGFGWLFVRGTQLAHATRYPTGISALGSAEAGVYSIGLSLGELTTIFSFPLAARALQNATLRRNSSHRREMAICLTTSLILSVALLVLAWPLIGLIYGREFEGALDSRRLPARSDCL